MRVRFVLSLIILWTCCLLVGCSETTEEVAPLVIEADDDRADVKTESDIFLDLMSYLDDYYFPTKAGKSRHQSFTYDVEMDKLQLITYYEPRFAIDKDIGIPLEMKIDINSEELVSDSLKEKLKKNEKRLALNNLNGHLGEIHNNVYFYGEETDRNDNFLYELIGVFKDDMRQGMIDMGMKQDFSEDYPEKHAALSEFLQMNLMDLYFLDLVHTNFDLVGMSGLMMSNPEKPGEPPVNTSLKINYQYENYIVSLKIFDDGSAGRSPVFMKDNGWNYSLEGEVLMPDGSSERMAKEDLESVQKYMAQTLANK